MKGFLFCLIALTSGLVKAEEPTIEKPISELLFYEQILEFNRTAGRLPGTTLEQEARFKEIAAEFQTEFAQRFVEFDVVITDATWADSWAAIKVVSKTPENLGSAAGLLAERELPLKCERDIVDGLQRDQNATIRALERAQNATVRTHLAWRPRDGSVGTAEQWNPTSPALFYSLQTSVLSGCFVSRKFDIIIGKQVLTFEQSELEAPQ